MYVAVTRECDPLSVPELTPINASFRVETLYPNPTLNEISLRLKSDKNNKLNVEIYSADGKMMKQVVKTLNTGAQTISIKLSELPSGSCILRISSADGYRYSRNIQKF
jgi:hypothetical protein